MDQDTAEGRVVGRRSATQARDVFGKRIRLTRDGLSYGEQFLPFAEMDSARPASEVIWNPATKLFEVAMFRRHGPPLVVRNLQSRTAERLRRAIIDALRERRRSS